MENQANTTAVTVVETVKVLGRPCNPESARQKRINELAERKAAGMLKLGRPVKEGSARQAKLAERAEKEAAGVELKRGRPTVAGSARQLKIDALNAKKAAGIEIKRGRPKFVKTEEVTELTVNDLVVTEVEVEFVPEEIVMETGDSIIETLKKDKRKNKNK